MRGATMRLDAALSKIVDENGRVAYGDIDEQAIAATLDDIAQADLAGTSRNDQYAFLLNAYNAWALALAHRQLHGNGMRNPLRWLRFFVLTPIRVAGRRTNLLLLEFLRLKPFLRRDPRGHFALVCASNGCPPLRNGEFHGDTLDQELDGAGHAFLRPGAGYLADRKNNVVWTSRILKWYRRDFQAMGGIREVLVLYASDEDGAWLRTARPRIRFTRYDWRRNDA